MSPSKIFDKQHSGALVRAAAASAKEMMMGKTPWPSLTIVLALCAFPSSSIGVCIA
jgi:hypothetical protein